MVNKYSKFQMDTFDSFWEMDSLTKNLTVPDADAGVTTIGFYLDFFSSKSRAKNHFFQDNISL